MSKKPKPEVRSSALPRRRNRNPLTFRGFVSRIERLDRKRAHYRSKIIDPDRAAPENRARVERRNLGYERAAARVTDEIANTRMKRSP